MGIIKNGDVKVNSHFPVRNIHVSSSHEGNCNSKNFRQIVFAKTRRKSNGEFSVDALFKPNKNVTINKNNLHGVLDTDIDCDNHKHSNDELSELCHGNYSIPFSYRNDVYNDVPSDVGNFFHRQPTPSNETRENESELVLHPAVCDDMDSRDFAIVTERSNRNSLCESDNLSSCTPVTATPTMRSILYHLEMIPERGPERCQSTATSGYDRCQTQTLQQTNSTMATVPTPANSPLSMTVCPPSRHIRSVPELRKINPLRVKHTKSPNPSNPGLLFLQLLCQVLLISRITYCQVPPITAVYDDVRCFLQPGGSVANFFINESLSIGSLIGSLQISGDPTEGGDIHLMLADRGVPVQIANHSKDLILTGRIDKEGKLGQSHIYVNVICKKLGTKDPTVSIPVNIRVTDVNDNAPVFQGAPYSVNVSEATVVGTIIFSDIHATDEDQKGPFSTLKYTIGPGPHHDTFDFESPLRGSLRLKKPLDYETSPVFNVTIVAQDLGSPHQRSKAVLTVYVADSDDQNPAFTRQRYKATLPQQAVRGSLLEIQPERIWAQDQDKGIMARVSFSLGTDVPEAGLFNIDKYTGNVFLTADVTANQITQPVSLSVYATQVDNPDRVASSILTVSRRGFRSAQLQFVRTTYNVSVPENMQRHTVIADTLINRDIDQNIRFRMGPSGAGVFKINSQGQVVLDADLDYEESTSRVYDLQVFVTDGVYNDTAQVHVTVLNVNDWDPRFRYQQYEFTVAQEQWMQEQGEEGALLGTVEVADGDKGDKIQLSLQGQDASLFSISPNGELYLRSLVGLNSSEAHVVVVAKDSGSPPRQSSVPVTVKLPSAVTSLAASSQPIPWFLLVLVFGGLLAIFILIVICLVVYIHKNKKEREDPVAPLPTKLSQLVPPGMGNSAGKVHPLPLSAKSRNGRTDMPSRSNSSMHHNLTNRNNAGFEGSEREDDDERSSPPLSHDRRRRYSKNSVAPQPSNGSGSSNSSANGDGASLNGTSSTASVGTPEVTRGGSGSSHDGIVRATGGLPLHPRMTSVPPPPPPPPPSRTAPTSYVYSNSTSHPHYGGFLSFSPRHRSPGSPFGESRSTFSPHLLRPPSAFSSGGSSMVCEPGAINTAMYDPTSSRCVWPAGSIPKRVKKLSWEDELYSQTELDPEVSVTPMPHRESSSSSQHHGEGPGLTVYF